jgi:hypothetical protein
VLMCHYLTFAEVRGSRSVCASAATVTHLLQTCHCAQVGNLACTTKDWRSISWVPTLGCVSRLVIKLEDKGTGINCPVDITTPYYRYSIMARECLFYLFSTFARFAHAGCTHRGLGPQNLL